MGWESSGVVKFDRLLLVLVMDIVGDIVHAMLYFAVNNKLCIKYNYMICYVKNDLSFPCSTFKIYHRTYSILKIVRLTSVT